MAKRIPTPIGQTRPVLTIYYLKNGDKLTVLQTNRSASANNAVKNCVGHMQLNHYGANVAEIHDQRDMVLHAQIVYDVKGEMRIAYKRPVKEGM